MDVCARRPAGRRALQEHVPPASGDYHTFEILGESVLSVRKIGPVLATLLVANNMMAGAERGNFPKVFARTDRYGIPVLNLVIMAIIMTAAAFLTMSPTLGQQFSKLIEVSTVLCLIVYVYSALALWRYEITRPYRVLAVLGALASLAVIILSGAQMLLLAAALVLATIVLYPFQRRAVARV